MAAEILDDAQAPSTAVESLASFLCRAELSDLAPMALARSRQCLVDAVACAGAGYRHPAVAGAARWAQAALPGDEASTWFDSQRLSTIGAAFVNATAASVLDLDDGHRAASGHPGAAVVPAVLTLARSTSMDPAIDMERLLLAIACGYEAGVRAARGRDPASLRSVASGRWTALAVAAAACRLQGASMPVMAHAMAIAESQAPNMMAADDAGFAGSDIKEGIPWSVLAGLAAAQQAAMGLRGYLGALDNPAVYLPGNVKAGLGERWLIGDTYFKRYACCRWIHAAIDAALELRPSIANADAIDRIEVHTFRRAIDLANDPRPKDVIAAQFSIPFCVASALAGGIDCIDRIRPELLRRPEILALAAKVELRLDDAQDRMFPARVPALLRVRADGEWLAREVLVPMGDPGNPMPCSEFAAKVGKLLCIEAGHPLLREVVPSIFSAARWSSARSGQALNIIDAILQREPKPEAEQAVLIRPSHHV